MRLLRHYVAQRLVSFALLGGLGLWLVAPATGAARPVGFDAPPHVEAAFEQALAAADGTPEAFVAAFAEALGADPNLAPLLDEHGGTEALLAVLYGQLLRAFGHERGVEAAPAPPVAAPSGASPSAAWTHRASAAVLTPATLTPRLAPGRLAVPLAVLSSAQPLGP